MRVDEQPSHTYSNLSTNLKFNFRRINLNLSRTCSYKTRNISRLNKNWYLGTKYPIWNRKVYLQEVRDTCNWEFQLPGDNGIWQLVPRWKFIAHSAFLSLERLMHKHDVVNRKKKNYTLVCFWVKVYGWNVLFVYLFHSSMPSKVILFHILKIVTWGISSYKNSKTTTETISCWWHTEEAKSSAFKVLASPKSPG